MASLMMADRPSGAAPPPFIVAVGGALRPNSSTEKALSVVLGAAAALGAETLLLSGADLDLPHYSPDRLDRSPAAQRLVEALRRADGIVLGSPGYHGGISGLVKNALDYVEDMRSDPAPYFEGRAVGCIATAAGWQATMTTLAALRDVVHALRGWPTPLGVPINTMDPAFGPDGACLSPRLHAQLEVVAQQIVGFAHQRAAARAAG
ncbi:MAG: NADPH-dependent FMN reductase [Aliidongia sp.]